MLRRNFRHPWGPRLAALAALLPLGAPATARALDTYHQEKTRVGGPAYIVAMGDLNGDRRPDLATPVLSEAQKGIALLTQRRSGEFATSYVPAGDYPVFTAIGDIDGDGRSDLAVSYEIANTVSILLQQADGRWHRGDLPVDVSEDWVKVGDFNGDGHTDLATANGSDANVTLLLQQSDGSFTARRFDVVGPVSSLATDDIDGDGVTDLAASVYYEDPPTTTGGYETTHVSLFTHRADDGFDRVDLPVAATSRSVSSGDVDQDGREDLVVTSDPHDLNAASLLVLYQRPGGSFERSKLLAAGDLVDAWGPLTQAAVADVDDDRDKDFVLDAVNDPELRFLIQGPEGEFAPAPRLATYATGGHDLTVGDLNRDGRPDLITAGAFVRTMTDTGQPIPNCRGMEPDLVGTDGRDRFNDYSAPVVQGLEGNDLIADGDPGQVACGGAGRDSFWIPNGRVPGGRLFGGSGSDTLYAANHDQIQGQITFFAGAGDDRLLGGAFADELEGGGGNDRILAGPGADRARGGAGADDIGGGDGDDSLSGNSGDDRLRGRAGRDSADGGPGRDNCAAEIKRDCEP